METSKPQMLFNESDINRVNIFLGGTCGANENGWDWRRQLIAHFPENFSYYDPFIRSWEYPDLEWDDSFIELENQAKHHCAIAIYVLTPEMRGVYSIAEITEQLLSPDFITEGDSVMIVVEDGNGEIGEKTFTPEIKKSLDACCKLWKSYGASILTFDQLTAEFDKLNNSWAQF